MDTKIKSIIIYDNINNLNKLNLKKSNDIIIFYLNKNFKDFLKINNNYQKHNKKLIYFIYHKDYNSIKKYIRDSDIYIYYDSQDDIDLYNYFLDNIEFLNNE
jgi:hypothetical protein